MTSALSVEFPFERFSNAVFGSVGKACCCYTVTVAAAATVVTVGPVLAALVGQDIAKKVVKVAKWLAIINGRGALQRRRRFFERFRAIFRGLSLDFKVLSYFTRTSEPSVGLIVVQLSWCC